MPDQTPSFEDALAELEAIVDTLERGDNMPLDESLNMLDHGLNMARSPTAHIFGVTPPTPIDFK